MLITVSGWRSVWLLFRGLMLSAPSQRFLLRTIERLGEYRCPWLRV